MSDILDYTAHLVKDADHVELRACPHSVSLVLFNDKNLPYAAASFTAEGWLPVVKAISEKCLEILSEDGDG